ncbi:MULTISPECIES: DUF2213 domain-containing protein [unclassified Sphingomonas]|uniref:DUF2213 domain-containing protein n=1 Tax=unclassified Sphingomonas TaxID=196159 RepID=UPI0006F52BE2|nr:MULTISPECIES: DUF2213 domain-containing protein [unclassified Sphingomonas]KQX18407.1 hypothetical protein ASD17_14695 [Sphingomonas sp. Root1294]KQY72268.1 hypothetical protein ASD39_20280 [Sphingomonas sp. Root50]KRB94461.1 hypothetical protein ASE22_00470 [Sphingomonas sp. Root720]
MLFTDRLTLDAPKKVQGGFLAVRAKAARTGVYQYTGREVDPDNKHGLRDTAVVNVLRDEATVFDTAAVQSFIGKPVTDDHPHESVTSSNWRDHARGTIMGAMRDGEYLAFDLLLMDQSTIDKVNAGKRELSNGYVADIEFGDFKAADGTACQARQSRITDGNHVALVKYGRAGGDCAIKDGFALCDALPSHFLDGLTKEKLVKTMLIDGLTVDISNADTAEKTITTILAARDAANVKVTDLETKVATLTTEGATKDAQIQTLEQQAKDAKPTAAQLRDAAKAYALVCDKAKALGVQFAEDADADAIMKAVVDAKMGDAAKDWSADQVAASFAVLSKDAAPADPLREVFRDGIRQPANGAKAVDSQRRRWLADKANAHRIQPRA